MAEREYIRAIRLDQGSIIARTPEVEHERAVAIADLLEENRFSLPELRRGPYDVTLSIADNRLVFDILGEGDAVPTRVQLSVGGLRSIVRDYFLICESYFAAIKTASSARIEAIDMGRRGVHDEGSEQVRDLLAGKIDTDKETARRLFTLICVLHIK